MNLCKCCGFVEACTCVEGYLKSTYNSWCTLKTHGNIDPIVAQGTPLLHSERSLSAVGGRD